MFVRECVCVCVSAHAPLAEVGNVGALLVDAAIPHLGHAVRRVQAAVQIVAVAVLRLSSFNCYTYTI